MRSPLTFSIFHSSAECDARLGRVETLHGGFDTPAFIPVGTRAAVKGLSAEQVRATGAQIILANTFHLMLRPGADLIRDVGGLHEFMRWGGPILTDSGGYQVFSLAHIRSIDDDGVTFKSIIDGSPVHLGPQRAMEVQNALGADIIMAFDDCAPAAAEPPADAACPARPEEAQHRHRQAHERTLRWLDRCVAGHARPDEQALFGIVQGGTDPALRRASARGVCGVDLPGYAIGGVAVGESTEQIAQIVQFTAPLLPAGRPRYLMGVGYETDIVMAVRAGVDMFDCVLPTRNGRNANAFTREGRLHLRNARFSRDQRVIEAGCDCPACAGGYGRAYLRHLFAAGEMLGPILTSAHNLRHYQRLMLDIHRVIREDSWFRLPESWPVLNRTSDEAVAGPLDDSEL